MQYPLSNYTSPLNSIPTFILILLGAFAFISADLHAQSSPFRLVPLSASPATAGPSIQTRQQALFAGDTMRTLPFWDDFSQPLVDTSGFATPDTSNWIKNTGVLINTGLGIDPPTLGVASFDGAALKGEPHANDSSSIGLSDELTACPINLAMVPEAERSSVYFSFFWQPQGRGDFPESPGDSLRLQFSTADTLEANRWITVWQRSGGDSSLTVDAFVQAMLPVNNPAFFHDRFQFRFQSYSRQSGAFDTWNIDYVYLNKGRTADNLAYPDAAITSLPTSLFGEYTRVPMKQFRADPARYLAEPSAQYYNLRNQPVGTAFESFVSNALTGETLDRLSTDRNTLSPLPTAFDRRTMTVDPLDASTLDLTQDSLYLETEFYINTGDKPLIESITAQGDTTFSQAVDYRVNDTVRTTFVLNESFAYDDGTAEFGVELNQTGGRVAYQFVAPTADLLTHIDIHFPNLTQNPGILLKLFVWKTLNDTTGNEGVLRQTGTLPVIVKNTNNGFASYQLESPVTVQDTFYIGYQQESSDRFVVVGFDKNTNTGDRIFFNVSTAWEQNTDLQGSLMMRPRFDRERAQLVTDLPDKEKPAVDLVVFPNPSTGQFQIQGHFDELRVVDVLGREIKRTSYTQAPVNLTGYQPGLYIFQFRANGKMLTRKVMLQP